MDNENVYQQRTNSKGDVTFRSKFGRQKAFVLCKKGEFYYIDLYDNRPGKTDRIGLGLDELDALIRMRTHCESLKQCFPTQTFVVKTLYQPTEFKRPATPPRPFTVERMPLQNQTSLLNNKRPASGDEQVEIKKPMLENVSPVTTMIMQKWQTFFYAPLFQDY